MLSDKVLLALQRVSVYLPILGVVVVLLAATFYSDLLQRVPTQLLLAIMASSFVLTAVHLEARLALAGQALTGVREQQKKVEGRLAKLEERQTEYLAASLPVLHTGSLADVFYEVKRRTGRIGHLRIYAISSQQILAFVQQYGFAVQKCTILLRGLDPSVAANQEAVTMIQSYVRDWRQMARNGQIVDLQIRSYDFFPTEYECIFDDTHLLLGIYDSDPADWSGTQTRRATLVDGSTPTGRDMIREYTERFDRLFETCGHHHGPDWYNTR